MKKELFVLGFAFASLSAVAEPPKRPTLENVVVKDFRQSGNLMPGPARPRRIQTTFVLEVMSNGCTKAGDFEVQVELNGDYQEVTVKRTKPDDCKGLARRAFVDMEVEGFLPSYSRPIRVLNPLLVEQRFVH
jgi:hypothetical protein